MRCMLIDNIQTVIVFYQPVGFEYLTDYFIFLHGLSGKQMIFEKFHLFWWIWRSCLS